MGKKGGLKVGIKESIEESYQPNIFIEEFASFLKTNKKGLGKLRRVVQKQTLNAIEKNKYIQFNQKFQVYKDKNDIIKEIQNTRMFSEKELKEITSTKDNLSSKKATIKVINQDCLEEAVKLKKMGLKPVVLNMACATNAGGGFRSGSGAQEENLFRRTTLSNCFYNVSRSKTKIEVTYSKKNPIPTYSGVLNRDITVFRHSEASGYQYMDKPVKIDVIAVPALKNPQRKKLENSYFEKFNYLKILGEEMYTKKTEEITLGKIRTIFKIAKHNKNDCLVLCAFGCGSYRNPSFHCAHLFRLIVEEFKYDFKRIVFAILEDHNSPKFGNFEPFKIVFEKFQKS